LRSSSARLLFGGGGGFLSAAVYGFFGRPSRKPIPSLQGSAMAAAAMSFFMVSPISVGGGQNARKF